MATFKERFVEKALDFTDNWNLVIHNSFENRILAEFRRSFPDGIQDDDEKTKIMERMRQFYYTRMMTTATMILAIASLMVSLIALLIATFAL